MADAELFAPGVKAAPLIYDVPGGQEIGLKVASATFDGTGAGASWQPAIQIVGPSGQVLRTFALEPALAAGASADVTFFPGGGVGATTPDVPSSVGDLYANGAGQLIPAYPANGLLDWVFASGPGLLDVTTAYAPTVKVGGVYAVTITVKCLDGIQAAGENMYVELDSDVLAVDAFANAVFPLDGAQVSDKPYGSVASTFYIPAGGTIEATTSTHVVGGLHFALIASVQLLQD